MLALYGSFFIFTTLLTYALIGIPAQRKEHIRKRIEAYFVSNTPSNQTDMEEQQASFFKRVIQPFWISLKRKYAKSLEKEEASKLEHLLLKAGQPFGLSPVEFKMVKLILMVGLPLYGLLIGLLTGIQTKYILLIMIFFLGLAILLPKQYLKQRIQKRNKLAGKELPDVLDLLTISLEAGLGFDSALSQVVSKKKGEVIKEFKIALEEMRLGKTRKEALSAINDRLDSEEMRSLVYNVVQAEKLGIGMVSVLRVQTEDLREQRRQKAEEAAMKAPIKMMFPLVLFIFPTLFIVLLGPAILQIIEAFTQ
ncbi:type II secretion system F family protein [Oceanobacillus piezotolerans]|uniref:Type II secretion system F family protein n=1 Tax=Oceanobacillus piezotolerans TaxID=2448030 RepID=A0A498D903_9BACI|nr:type II secretion system F family protein [Oceanobacillus piezotolerans]RLL47036.1 type II secretion system F family protein [Oceanobacillus piezotolerans]